MTLIKRIKRKICAASLLFSLSIITFGQRNNIATQKMLWRARADTISGSLLKDTIKQNELERALLFAKLGDLWWKSDPNQSNAWFEKSVDTIFFYSSEDIKNKKKDYFDATRNILSVIADRNQKQTNRLIKILSNTNKNSEEEEEEKESNADALIKYALRIVKENPNQATQIGITALRTGNAKEFYKLIWELRRYNNTTLADQLFSEAFSIARVSHNYNMLQGIQLAALPESAINNFPSNLSASNQQKVEVLNFFADYLIQLSYSVNAKTISSCSGEALVINRSRRFYETLLPQKAGIVQQAIDSCLSKKTQSVSENIEKPSKELNIEELLSLADDNKDDPTVRIGYLTKAVSLANNQKKYALVIKIVDSLTDKELAGDAEFWEQMRYDAAGNLAYLQYQESNNQGALKTLQNVPAQYRLFAQVVFVKQFSPKETSSYSFQVDVLNDARKSFIASEKPFAEKSDYWFTLVKFYSKHKLYTDASDVFREVVKAFNNSISEKETNQTQISSGAIAGAFSPTLLETQENKIFETVNLINEPKSRLNVNLALLKVALQKYESLNSVPTKTNSKVSSSYFKED